MGARYMIDDIMNASTTAIDEVKRKVSNVQNIRDKNRSVKKQLRALDAPDQD